ncbi:24057_t:CDS:2, partial [Dentiscutata erythropus]
MYFDSLVLQSLCIDAKPPKLINEMLDNFASRMTSKTSKIIKGTKVSERPTTRASTRTELPFKCDTDSEKSQIIFTNKPADTVTPSATISAATTRASSVDPPRQLSESLTKVKRRNCQSSKKDGVVHKKTSKPKKAT